MRTELHGGTITASGDSRVSPLGGWLRKFKLDELPQFVNVLRGEMGIIGPRPEVPDYVKFDDPIWKEVLSARPGITDLASLTFRDEEQLLGSAPNPEAYYRSVILPSKLRLNVQYLRTRSLAADLKLIWLTMVYSWIPGRFNRHRVLQTLANGTGSQEVL
jgi:lipopolysaccharide/colanic/teichoic acid biosynthesis glycosyltransferase